MAAHRQDGLYGHYGLNGLLREIVALGESISSTLSIQSI